MLQAPAGLRLIEPTARREDGPDLTFNGIADAFVARISILSCPMAAYGNGLAVDFGTAGLYYYNGSSWSQISTNNPQWLTTYNGNLAADFGAYGLYSYNGSSWSQISTADADNTGNTMVSYNGLAVDFGTSGLYHYHGTTWHHYSTNNPEWLTSYNGNLAGDFATYGLYSYNGSSWSQISTADPDS